MKGICARCQLKAGETIPGKTVWCEENQAGAICVRLGDLTFWLIYSGFPREAFKITAQGLNICAPIIEKNMLDAIKTVSPKSND